MVPERRRPCSRELGAFARGESRRTRRAVAVDDFAPASSRRGSSGIRGRAQAGKLVGDRPGRPAGLSRTGDAPSAEVAVATTR